MAKEAIEKLVEGLKSLSELEVKTVVGNVEFTIDGDGNAKLKESSSALKGCYTNINLVAGDMRNLIDEKYTEEGDRVLAFHREQVKTGREIVRNNVDVLIKLSSAAGAAIAPLLDMKKEDS